MKIKSIMRVIAVVSITVVSLIACSENKDLDLPNLRSKGVEVSSDGKFVFEDFLITEVDGDEIHGEKIDGEGEGIFLLESSLKDLIDSDEKIMKGDQIEVAYKVEDYMNDIWDNIQGIEFIN
jgi:hypothetical protein